MLMWVMSLKGKGHTIWNMEKHLDIEMLSVCVLPGPSSEGELTEN